MENNSTQDGKTVVVNIPRAGHSLGLMGIIEWLIVGALWACWGIGCLCVPGALVGFVLGMVCAAINLGNLGAVGVCLGAAVVSLGACLPLFFGMRAALPALKNQSRALAGSNAPKESVPGIPKERKMLFFASLAIVAVGAVLWGIAALAGGIDAVVLPSLIAGLFA